MPGRRKPPPLRPGDTIALVTTSSPLPEPATVQRVIGAVEARGYRVALSPNFNARHGYLAGSDRQRADDLMWALGSDEFAAVLSLRGGYGCARLYELIDWDSLRAARPRVVCGFSDLTALHLMIERELGWVTFHGPNGWELADIGSFSERELWRALRPVPLGDVPGDPDHGGCVWRVSGGVAEGELAGGCQFLLAQAIGTPFAPALAGRVVLLEETRAEPYMVEADLCHLLSAGMLEGVAGIVYAAHELRVPDYYTGMFQHSKSWQDVVEEWLGGLGVPVIANLPLGHGRNLATLPLGCRARIDGDRGLLTVLEPGVQSVEEAAA